MVKTSSLGSSGVEKTNWDQQLEQRRASEQQGTWASWKTAGYSAPFPSVSSYETHLLPVVPVLRVDGYACFLGVADSFAAMSHYLAEPGASRGPAEVCLMRELWSQEKRV